MYQVTNSSSSFNPQGQINFYNQQAAPNTTPIKIQPSSHSYKKTPISSHKKMIPSTSKPPLAITGSSEKSKQSQLDLREAQAFSNMQHTNGGQANLGSISNISRQATQRPTVQKSHKKSQPRQKSNSSVGNKKGLINEFQASNQLDQSPLAFTSRIQMLNSGSNNSHAHDASVSPMQSNRQASSKAQQINSKALKIPLYKNSQTKDSFNRTETFNMFDQRTDSLNDYATQRLSMQRYKDGYFEETSANGFCERKGLLNLNSAKNDAFEKGPSCLIVQQVNSQILKAGEHPSTTTNSIIQSRKISESSISKKKQQRVDGSNQYASREKRQASGIFGKQNTNFIQSPKNLNINLQQKQCKIYSAKRTIEAEESQQLSEVSMSKNDFDNCENVSTYRRPMDEEINLKNHAYHSGANSEAWGYQKGQIQYKSMANGQSSIVVQKLVVKANNYMSENGSNKQKASDNQSRNQVFSKEKQFDAYSTLKIQFTQSQFTDELGDYQKKPLQTIDSNQALISSPKLETRMFEMPQPNSIFSPAKLLRQANHSKNSDSNTNKSTAAAALQNHVKKGSQPNNHKIMNNFSDEESYLESEPSAQDSHSPSKTPQTFDKKAKLALKDLKPSHNRNNSSSMMSSSDQSHKNLHTPKLINKQEGTLKNNQGNGGKESKNKGKNFNYEQKQGRIPNQKSRIQVQEGDDLNYQPQIYSRNFVESAMSDQISNGFIKEADEMNNQDENMLSELSTNGNRKTLKKDYQVCYASTQSLLRQVKDGINQAKDARIDNDTPKEQYAQIVQLSEIQTQGDLHQPYKKNLISKKQKDNLNKIADKTILNHNQSRNDIMDSPPLPFKRVANQIGFENVFIPGFTSDSANQEYNQLKSTILNNNQLNSQNDKKIFQKKDLQLYLMQEDSNYFKSDILQQSGAQTVRLAVLSSVDSQPHKAVNQSTSYKNPSQLRSSSINRVENSNNGYSTFSDYKQRGSSINQTNTQSMFGGNQHMNIDRGMQELNLRLTNISELNSTLFLMNSQLKVVDLRNNKIKELPESIGELRQLRKLRVDYNYLTKLPESMLSLSKLELFTGSFNRIMKLPDKFFECLTGLSVIVLSENKIQQLDTAINNLQHLAILNLNDNPIVELPLTLGELKHLQEFSLDWFIYFDSTKQTAKHQKGQGSKQIISEFQMFLLSLQTSSCLNKISLDQAHFIHFLMYFHKVKSVQEIQMILFSTKQRSIFHQMALNGHLYLFDDLYTNFHGAQFDINKLDQDESTPFLLAIRNKRKQFVKALLALPQTNINRPSKKYGHPLHLTIKSHEFKLALQMLKGVQMSFHRHIDVNCVSEDGNNALHYLFSHFYIKPEICIEIASQLIRKGINLNLKNKNDFSPLHIAIIGGQHSAIQFALNYNTEQKLKSNPYQLFNFNLKGGKLNQNCLYLAIQQNNIRVISTLLQSQENLDFLAVDDEGRQPKDICPYNSPVYKLLTQYELNHYKLCSEKPVNILTVNDNEGIFAYDSLSKTLNFNSTRPKRGQDTLVTGNMLIHQEISQFYINKRYFESPNKVRQRILDQAHKHQENQKKKHNNSSFQRGRSVVTSTKHRNQSLNQQKQRIYQQNQATGGYQFKRENSLASVGGGGIIPLITESKVEAKHRESRAFSHAHRASDGVQKEKERVESERDLLGREEWHKMGKRSPYSRKLSINYSTNSLCSRKVKPQMSPLNQKEISQDVFNDEPSYIQQNIVQHNIQTHRFNGQSLISSADSQITRTLFKNNIRESDPTSLRDSQLESNFHSSKLGSILVNQSNHLGDVKYLQNQKDWIKIQKTNCKQIQLLKFEEDEVRIEEEEAEAAEEELQEEEKEDIQKPQLRQIVKSPSQKGQFTPSSPFLPETLQFTKSIIESITYWKQRTTEQRIKTNMQTTFNMRNDADIYQTIPTAELIQCSSQPTMQNQIPLPDLLDENHQLSDFSQIYQVLDESTQGIQQPMEHSQNLKIAAGIQIKSSEKYHQAQFSSSSFLKSYQHIEEIYRCVASRRTYSHLQELMLPIAKAKEKYLLIDALYIVYQQLDQTKALLNFSWTLQVISDLQGQKNLYRLVQLEILNILAQLKYTNQTPKVRVKPIFEAKSLQESPLKKSLTSRFNRGDNSNYNSVTQINTLKNSVKKSPSMVMLEDHHRHQPHHSKNYSKYRTKQGNFILQSDNFNPSSLLNSSSLCQGEGAPEYASLSYYSQRKENGQQLIEDFQEGKIKIDFKQNLLFSDSKEPKQFLSKRQSIESSNDYQMKSGQNKISLNFKGSRTLQQIKQPLKDKERAYIKHLQQTEIQNLNQQSLTHHEMTTLRKKESVEKFTQNFQNLIEDGSFSMNKSQKQANQEVLQDKNVQAKLQMLRGSKPLFINNMIKSTLMKKNQQHQQQQIQFMNTQRFEIKGKGSQILQNRDKADSLSRQPQKSQVQTPISTKLGVKSNQKQGETQIRSTKEKELIQTLTAHKYQKNSMLSNKTTTNKQLKQHFQESNQQFQTFTYKKDNRNEKNQNKNDLESRLYGSGIGVFEIEDPSLNKLAIRLNYNNQDELAPYQANSPQLFQEYGEDAEFDHLDEDIIQFQEEHQLRTSQLQIQVFTNEEEFESMSQQLRIKDKWHQLKESHTQKMGKVHQSAIKTKNMFSAHQNSRKDSTPLGKGKGQGAQYSAQNDLIKSMLSSDKGQQNYYENRVQSQSKSVDRKTSSLYNHKNLANQTQNSLPIFKIQQNTFASKDAQGRALKSEKQTAQQTFLSKKYKNLFRNSESSQQQQSKRVVKLSQKNSEYNFQESRVNSPDQKQLQKGL